LAPVIENDPANESHPVELRRDQLFELLAQSRLASAYFVVARRGKNASARSSSARRRAISRRSQLSAAGSLLLDPVRQFRNLIEHTAPLGHQRADLTISVHDGCVITTAELLSDLGQ
jgi:hypothetical protein